MRILFLSTVYPTPWEPFKGPANRSTVESLRAIGCEVLVVAPVPWPKRLLNSRHPAPPGEYPTYWYPPGILHRYYHRALHWSVGATLERVARDFRPDAVLAFWTHPDGTVALQFAQQHQIPVGIIVGGSDVILLPESASRRLPITITLRYADRLFAVGSDLMKRAVDLGAPSERVSNFFCGVDLQAFVPGDRATARRTLGLPMDGPLLLWIGSMVRVKAAERLLEAVGRLVATTPDLQVAMVGDGPERGKLTELVFKNPALREHVIFPGAVDHAFLPLWYRSADLFVLPSRSEGVPNVLLEAMAMGLPFVASDVGSIRDLLPFGPSRVVPEGDITALTTAIEEILAQHPGERIAPRRYDRLDGARHLLEHLQASRQ